MIAPTALLPALCRRIGRPAHLLVWLFLGITGGHAASPKREEAEKFFADGTIPYLRIRIPTTNMARLRGNARDYVRATVSESDTVYQEVGVHLKGAAGSFRGVDDGKPAFTLNFDKFIDGQNFHGIDKLSLNNSVQDQTYMTEAICSELFLAGQSSPSRSGIRRSESTSA